MTRTRTTARCLEPGCPWHMPPRDVVMSAARIDAAAEKHTREAVHGTTTSTVPVESEEKP